MLKPDQVYHGKRLVNPPVALSGDATRFGCDVFASTCLVSPEMEISLFATTKINRWGSPKLTFGGISQLVNENMAFIFSIFVQSPENVGDCMGSLSKIRCGQSKSRTSSEGRAWR